MTKQARPIDPAGRPRGRWAKAAVVLVTMALLCVVYPPLFHGLVGLLVSLGLVSISAFDDCAAPALSGSYSADDLAAGLAADLCGPGCWREVTIDETGLSDLLPMAEEWDDLNVVSVNDNLLLILTPVGATWYDNAQVMLRDRRIQSMTFNLSSTITAAELIEALGEPDRSWVSQLVYVDLPNFCWAGGLIWDDIGVAAVLDSYNSIVTPRFPPDARVLMIRIVPDGYSPARESYRSGVLEDTPQTGDWQGFDAMRLDEP